MNNRFDPPAVRRLSAVAIAAALATFAGVTAAQSARSGAHPGYATNTTGDIVRTGQGACLRSGQWSPALADPSCERMASASYVSPVIATSSAPAAASGASAAGPQPGYAMASGSVVRNASGQCVRTGHWNPSLADPSCERAAIASSGSAVMATSSSSAAPAGTLAASGASTAAATGPLPGYAVASGRVVQNTAGQCVRAGHWTPAHAAEPCDLVAQASVAPPPPPVVAQAPEPRLEPAPAPRLEPAPQPEPIAQPVPQPGPQPVPLAAPEPPRILIQKVTLSADLLFEFDKAQLRESGKEKLDELAANSKDAQVEEVVATGYADPIGSDRYNEKLSAERAAAVKEYLVQKGVESEKIKTAGRGETREFSEGRCEKLSGKKLIDCLEPNRRVDVELLGSRQVAATEAPAAGTGASGSGAGASSGSTAR